MVFSGRDFNMPDLDEHLIVGWIINLGVILCMLIIPLVGRVDCHDFMRHFKEVEMLVSNKDCERSDEVIAKIIRMNERLVSKQETNAHWDWFVDDDVLELKPIK